MAQSEAERQRAWRDRQRGTPPRDPKPCGTVAAARRHQRAGEPFCEPCRIAWNAHQVDMYHRKKSPN